MKCLAILFLGLTASLRAQAPLSLAEVAADPKIWPVEVMVTVDHKLPVVIDGKTAKTLKVGPGKIYRVKGITNSGVSVQGLGSLMVFQEDETDVLARAGQIRAHLAALAAATPTPAPTPTPVAAATPPTGNSPKLYRGPLPFSIKLPPHFAGPVLKDKGAEKTYLYLRRNPQGLGFAQIQISIRDLANDEAALPADALLQKSLEETRQRGVTIDLTPSVNGMLGSLPVREAQWKGSSNTERMAGVSYAFVKEDKFYSVDIADTETLAPQTLPELKSSLQTLRFGERPPVPEASVLAGSPSSPPAAGTVAAKLTGQLVSLNGGRLEPFDAGRLSGKKYLAIYFSASWCGPCRRFTPALVEWYRMRQPFHADFEVIFVSSDRDERDMISYMAGDHMEWPAVAFNRTRSGPLAKYGGRGIPCLVILDENGRVVANSFEGDDYLGPMRPLKELDRLLTGS